MPIKTVRGEEKFILETDKERQRFEDARNYFGTAILLLINLGYNIRESRNAPRLFHRIKTGNSISIKNWNTVGTSGRFSIT